MGTELYSEIIHEVLKLPETIRAINDSYMKCEDKVLKGRSTMQMKTT